MEELRRCISAAVDPSTDPSSRDAANRQLYAFQNAPNSILVCLEALVPGDQLTSSPQDHAIFSFLLNVAKTQVSLFHDRWTADVRNRLRSQLITLYSRSPNQLPRLQEKLAGVLVEFIIREWPQLWPEAFDWIFSMLKDPVLMPSALLLLSSFLTALRSEDPAGMSQERRSELTAAFNEILPGITGWLVSQSAGLRAGDKRPTPPVMRLYGQLCGWARLEEPERLADWCIDVVKVDGSEEAIEALHELSDRPFKSASSVDNSLIDYWLEKGIGKVSLLLDAAVGEDYLFFRQLIDIACTVLSNILSALPNKRRRILTLLTDLLLYLSHPSLYVRSSLVMCLLDVMKASSKDTNESDDDWMVERVVERTVPLLIAILAEDPRKTFRTPDNQSDFEEEWADFSRCFEHLKSRIGELIERESVASPVCCTRLIHNQSMRLLGTANVKWQSAVLFVIQHGSIEDASVAQLQQDMLQSVLGLLAQHNTNQRVIEDSLYAVRSLSLTLHTDKDAFSRAFSAFIHFSSFRPKIESHDDGLAVRCRAMACMSTLAVSKPTAFLTHLPDFLELSKGLEGQRELRQWVETVISLACSGPMSAEQRMHLFKAVFVPLLAEISNLQLERFSERQGDFYSIIGLPWFLDSENRLKSESDGPQRSFRIHLANVMTLVQVTTKGLRPRHSLDSAVVNVIMSTFIPLMLQVLMLVSVAQSLSQGSSNYLYIFGDVSLDSEEPPSTDQFKYMRNWISHVRTVAHMTLGYLSEFAEYELERALVGLPEMRSVDRISLVRCFLGPLFKTNLGSSLLPPLLSFVRSDLAKPSSGDEESVEQRTEWISRFVGFICDIAGKRECILEYAQMADDYIRILICCIMNNSPVHVVGKLCGFLSDRLENVSKTDAVTGSLYSTLPSAILNNLPHRSATQSTLLSLLAEVYQHSVFSGYAFEPERQFSLVAKISQTEIDRLHLIATQSSVKTLKAALQSSLQPLLRQARAEPTVKKLVPDKLVILSKLRRAAEQEEIENDAISAAGTLFDFE